LGSRFACSWICTAARLTNLQPLPVPEFVEELHITLPQGPGIPLQKVHDGCSRWDGKVRGKQGQSTSGQPRQHPATILDLEQNTGTDSDPLLSSRFKREAGFEERQQLCI
jgi:hypothetical protein